MIRIVDSWGIRDLHYTTVWKCYILDSSHYKFNIQPWFIENFIHKLSEMKWNEKFAGGNWVTALRRPRCV